MNSIDSIYNKILSDIERTLPIPIKRPGSVKYKKAASVSEKTAFGEALNAASKAAGVSSGKPATVKEVNSKDVGSRIESAMVAAAARYGIDYALIKGIIKAESDFDPNCVSHAGAMGLMQLMPANCEEYSVTDPFNIEQNIDAGTRHIRDMLNRYDGDVSLALAAYNAGPGNVNKYGGIPPFKETQVYVPRVLANMESYKKG